MAEPSFCITVLLHSLGKFISS